MNETVNCGYLVHVKSVNDRIKRRVEVIEEVDDLQRTSRYTTLYTHLTKASQYRILILPQTGLSMWMLINTSEDAGTPCADMYAAVWRAVGKDPRCTWACARNTRHFPEVFAVG